MSGKGWKSPDMTGNDWKWLEWLEIVIYEWKWLEMAEDGWYGRKWLAIAENS